ncbi:ras guanine nucleotide exchange factor domain-containing protein [Fennellomyces sp. T-0311]|nr:ras guanine nucleotide exchange factor domain-containing protein [Fennellomyces sp. T-0311]
MALQSSPSTPIISASVLPDRHLKRRSKSVDDLGKSHLWHYYNVTTPTSPVVSFGPECSAVPSPNTPSPAELLRRQRRHSSSVEPNTKECLRLATIYGWVTANAYDTRIKESHARRPSILADRCRHQQHHLHTSRSFTQGTTNKLSKMFARRRKSLSSHLPTSSPITPTTKTFHRNEEETKGIVSAIIAAANRSSEEQSLGWVGVEDENNEEEYTADVEPPPPPAPPIENDPHVFDLLEQNSDRFINYSKRESSQLNSATVEKLVEKLTKEMDSEYMMDFFLTYRQFLSQIRLCKLLILRFRWALMEDSDERRLVRIRTFVVIRHWLTHYWAHDFVPSRTLRFMLCTFLSQLRTHPIILSSPRDARIIKNLRNVLKRQRKLFSICDEDVSIRSSLDTYTICSSSQRYGTGSTSSSSSAEQQQRQSSLPIRSRGSRKDSAIGMTIPPPKELKPSISTPVLPFFSRSRRISTTSSHHRSVNQGASAWTAKVNFGIRTIKRSVPTVCQSLWHNIHTHQQHEMCICEIEKKRRSRKSSTTSLMRSASRIFDNSQQHPRASLSTPMPSRSDPKHPNPLCPLHTVPMTPTPSQRILRHQHMSIDSTVGYKPFVLRYRSEVIAQQFYMIEQRMLQNVTWDELAELRWRNNRRVSTIVVDDENNMTTRGGIEQLINYFNMTCQWVASEIVQSRSLETRVRVIEKYIRIALKCYHHRNYSTLMQILLGLQSPAVSRLERTWQRIDHYEAQIFNELKEMAKPFRNWKNVRTAMNKAIENIAESSAVESVLTKSRADPGDHNVPGCIPFLGLYLSDLVFNAELPTFIASPSHASEDEDDSYAELRSRLTTHLVNYNKFRITASVIKHVLAFQVLSRTHDFDYYPDLFSRLQKLRFLDNGEIRKASILCEE